MLVSILIINRMLVLTPDFSFLGQKNLTISRKWTRNDFERIVARVSSGSHGF